MIWWHDEKHTHLFISTRLGGGWRPLLNSPSQKVTVLVHESLFIWQGNTWGYHLNEINDLSRISPASFPFQLTYQFRWWTLSYTEKERPGYSSSFPLIGDPHTNVIEGRRRSITLWKENRIVVLVKLNSGKKCPARSVSSINQLGRITHFQMRLSHGNYTGKWWSRGVFLCSTNLVKLMCDFVKLTLAFVVINCRTRP